MANSGENGHKKPFPKRQLHVKADKTEFVTHTVMV